MSDAATSLACYLVEWYRAGLPQDSIDRSFARLTRGAELPSADRTSATVVMTLTVPTDDVVFCIFEASSSEAVAQACEDAGLPAERVTAAMVAS
jgi:hypothetical protein